jgi:small-conductance mechanosensitive channel/CRP-like cAMP-binding protein
VPAVLDEVVSYAGVGLVVSIALLVLLRFVIPTESRSQLRAPIVFLVIAIAFFGAFAAIAFVPEHPAKGTLLTGAKIAALASYLIGLGRTFYLLLLHGALERRRRERGARKSLPAIFRDIIQAGVYGAIAFVCLHLAGVELGSLLATSAVLTAVIGFALQDTLGNLFAGLAIQTQQPFDVGDWIQFDDDSDHIGEVIEINWRATRILTIDQIEVTVPNGALAKAPIRNFSRPSKIVRRAIFLCAPQDTPPARMHQLFLESITDVEGVRASPPPDVNTWGFSDRGVEYRVRYYIDEFDRRDVIDGRVRDRLWYALKREAVQVPPPQRRITIATLDAAALEQDRAATAADVERAVGALPLFEPLPPPLVHQLATYTARRLYAPGELVIKQGDRGDELFIVERGKVDVLVGSNGAMEKVATLGPGDFFGEMSLLTGEQRRATVRAASEVALLAIGKDALSPILTESPQLATQMSEVLAARQLELGEHEIRDSDRQAREKIAERRGELLSRIRQFFSI